MRCPKCASEKTYVVDGAPNSETNEYYRRRRCAQCSHVFFTIEFDVEETEQFREDWKKSHRAWKASEKEKQKRRDKLAREKRNEPGSNRCAKCEHREDMGGLQCAGCEALTSRKNTIGKLFNKE